MRQSVKPVLVASRSFRQISRALIASDGGASEPRQLTPRDYDCVTRASGLQLAALLVSCSHSAARSLDVRQRASWLPASKGCFLLGTVSQRSPEVL